MTHENIYIYTLDWTLVKKCNVVTTAAEFLEVPTYHVYNAIYSGSPFQNRYYIVQNKQKGVPKQKPEKEMRTYYIYNKYKKLQYVASSRKSAAQYIKDSTGHEIKNIDAYVELNEIFQGLLYISDKHIYKFDKPAHPFYKGFDFKFVEEEK